MRVLVDGAVLFATSRYTGTISCPDGALVVSDMSDTGCDLDGWVFDID